MTKVVSLSVVIFGPRVYDTQIKTSLKQSHKNRSNQSQKAQTTMSQTKLEAHANVNTGCRVRM